MPVTDAGLARWLLYVIAVLAFAVSVALGYLVRRFLFGWLRRRAARTATPVDETVVNAVRSPFVVWCACGGFYVATRVAPLPFEFTKVSDRVLLALVVGSVTWALALIAVSLVRQYGARRGSSVAVVGLTQTTARIIVVVIGGLILLNALGISITPMLTALGIGGLAVALALQDTLSNTFAGIYITLSRHIRPGDYVRIEGGEEGVVMDITWRATTVRTIRNNVVIIPNSKLAQSVVTNYHLRESRHRLDIPIGVSYASDPEHVEQVLVDEASKAIGQVENLMNEPAPYVLFMPGFLDFSLGFTLVVHVRTYVDQFEVQHQLRKRIFKRFRAEGIEIPFPIRTVHIREPGRPAGHSNPGQES